MFNPVKSLIRWARTSAVQKDSGSFPTQQVEFLGKVGDAVPWYPYGMHAAAPIDHLALLLMLHGNREGRISMPSSYHLREKNLPDGEVIFYHPLTNSKIHFKADGTVAIVVDKDLIVDIDEDVTITIDGNVAINIAGDASIDSEGTVTIDGATAVDILSAAVSSNSPSHTIGDGTNDIVTLMAEVCQLVHDSQVTHSGSQPMDAATKALWVTLKAKVLTLA